MNHLIDILVRRISHDSHHILYIIKYNIINRFGRFQGDMIENHGEGSRFMKQYRQMKTSETTRLHLSPIANRLKK